MGIKMDIENMHVEPRIIDAMQPTPAVYMTMTVYGRTRKAMKM